jgi:hypothetical protein
MLKCIVARLSDLPLTDSDRETLSAELARIERGPTAADSGRPGLLASVLIVFGIPGVIAIAAALITSLFSTNTLPPLFWTWGVLSAIGLALLLFTPRWLGALLTRLEIRIFIPEERPGGSRSHDLRSALAAGIFRRAEFTTTAPDDLHIINVESIDDEGPTVLFNVADDHWLLLRGGEFDDLTDIDEHEVFYRIPQTLTLDWIPHTGTLLRLASHGPIHEIRARSYITAADPALSDTNATDLSRTITELHVHL